MVVDNRLAEYSERLYGRHYTEVMFTDASCHRLTGKHSYPRMDELCVGWSLGFYYEDVLYNVHRLCAASLVLETNAGPCILIGAQR